MSTLAMNVALDRIVSASAATGDIFRIAKPFPWPNMTYQIDLHVPAIKCENSSSAVARNTTAAAVIHSRDSDGALIVGEMQDGSVPSDFDFGALDMSLLEYHNGSTLLSIGYYAEHKLRTDDNGLFRHQLRIVVADHDDDNSTKPLFLTCTLWNASSSFNISYKDNVQSVQRENLIYVNELYERVNEALMGNKLGYLQFFGIISDQLSGLVAANTSRLPAGVSGVSRISLFGAKIKSTTLAGASEFVSMTRNYGETFTSANVTHSEPRNEYSYEYHNLVLAYGLAILFTLLSVILGWSAVVSNGMSYDFTVSSIIGTSQNPDLADLFRQQTPGTQPLDRQIRKTKLRFGAVAPRLSGNSAGLPGQRAAFGLEGTVSQLQKC
ncbi:hypothetical protein MMC07_006762 [Pseudocyphellaria aurata]|nr:hypothetical protein [Pseudocyphellaria aurata]